ncbi:N-6 DNA methylase [bacterium AH-315-C20]|nr:N-6 DNA methylase [bacterium AH-315-C20]MBN4077640.1 N-6 DNA methylase [bacterium AH-315-C20]
MALFQKSVLKKFLAQQDQEKVDKAYKKLAAYFHNPEIQENIRESKEEQFQEGFLRELFVTIFGYTLNPNQDFDLTTELKNEKGAKKADGAILKDGNALGVIELKSTKTKDLEKVRQQAFDYKANQTGCVYVITSNFEKLRFYINNAVDFEEFDLFSITEERFALLYLCLSKENILNNIPLKIKEASLQEEEAITKKFYADYSLFKRELYRDLVKQNMNNDVFIEELMHVETERAFKNIKLALFKKSQKLIDRFLFIFFAEDRGLLVPNSTLKILENWDKLKELDAAVPLYDRYKLYFTYLDTGRKGTDKKAEIFAYNGGLFKPDSVLDSLIIGDDLLYKHTDLLQAYDFDSQVDVNILGHIFENSLNEIESVNAEIEGTDFDKQKTKRKKDGVFYTPKYITKYIVDNTVGKLCEEKKAALKIEEEEYFKSRKGRTTKKLKELQDKLETYRKWLLKLTVCDPACGSGAFLNQALDYLINEHGYIDELQTNLLGGGFLFPDIENTVLENNIFGVDLNQESVEIAKLSLWLRTARPRRQLNDLSNNIKCGNSLIDSKAVAGDKAFKWEDEFAEIFSNGGFDVVIGNPPYGASFTDQEKDFVAKEYKSYQYKFESYLYFYEQGFNILREKGFLSFITPELFLRLEKSENIRRFLFDNSMLTELKFCGENVFSDVKVNSVILTLTKGDVQNDFFKIVPESDLVWNYSFSTWRQTPLLKIEYEISPIITHIIEKIDKNSTALGELGEAIQGLTPYDSYRGHSKELIKNRGYHFKEKVDASCGKWLDGKHVNRYSLIEGEEWLRYGDWLAAQREKRFFEGPRLLFREVPGQNKRIQATYTEITYYHGHSITPFIIGNGMSLDKLYEILGITNSKLLSWFAKYKSSNFSKNTFPKLNPKDIKNFPIPKKIVNSKTLVEMVQGLLEKQNDLTAIGQKFTSYLQSQFSIQKLSKKLQNWHALDFGDFITELNKAIKKVGGEKLSKSAEMDWMDVFETKKAEAQKLKVEIDKTDKEIDQLVYELYGLTDEEIEIVEGTAV